MYEPGSPLTPGVLIEKLGPLAGPAVWAYRDAVVSAACEVGVRVRANHDVGPVQIALTLLDVPELLIGWRVDHGWYFVRRHRRGEPPAIGPTRCRPGCDLLDRLLPEPMAVAHWLREITAGKWMGTEPALVTVTLEGLHAVLRGLRGYLSRAGAVGYRWSDRRPLHRPSSTVAS
jgi:hypothetical protein